MWVCACLCEWTAWGLWTEQLDGEVNFTCPSSLYVSPSNRPASDTHIRACIQPYVHTLLATLLWLDLPSHLNCFTVEKKKTYNAHSNRQKAHCSPNRNVTNSLFLSFIPRKTLDLNSGVHHKHQGSLESLSVTDFDTLKHNGKNRYRE